MPQTRLDIIHEELIEWADDLYSQLGVNHRVARIQAHSKKCQEEVLEFLRDPCAEEAIDVIFALWIWADSQQINLSTLMHEKLSELRSRQWELLPDGTVHHTKEIA